MRTEASFAGFNLIFEFTDTQRSIYHGREFRASDESDLQVRFH